jgi:hypothetical protein
MKEMVKKNREDSQWGMLNPDERHRKALSLQAMKLMRGEKRWMPTWQNFSDDWRAMYGSEDGAGAGEVVESESRAP